ncbi:MAG: exosortase H [Candidatus Zixiibacteriota bacterium]|nr:MAG: exosortase H [candidate division Zixibacteria bacterium]
MKASKSKLKTPVIKSLVKLYLTFGAAILFFIIAFQFNFVHETVVVPFTAFVAHCSSILMNIFGAGSKVTGYTLSTSKYSINVVDGCNGIYATAILISGVIAYPASLPHKFYGIAFGFTAVFLVNLIRVISLFYMGLHFPDIFQEVHVYVWQPIIILWAIIVWNFWSKKTEEKTA